MELTDFDRKILRVLQDDSRIANQELAEKVGMSASACWRRVKAMEEAGIITGYVALVAAEKAGFDFHAIVQVSLRRHEREHADQFIEAIARRSEVLECMSTTGEADYHLRIVLKDKDAYNRFLDDFLFRLPGIANVRTNVVLKDIKLTMKLPL